MAEGYEGDRTGRSRMLPPLSLYIHFPWCVAKCPYCDFNSHSLRGEMPADEYIDALVAEVSATAQQISGRTIQSIFFGGGTPSLFSPQHYVRLFEAIHEHFAIDAAAEITMEANPGAIEHGSFVAYRQAGINRLSLGVQSFSDTHLKSLGRIHDAAAARSAFQSARDAGFDNINLDLMYALPKQSVSEALDDLDAAMSLRPEHLSFYHLTLEPNTVFYAQPPPLPDSDMAWDMQIQGAAFLQGKGYANYEVSAWSLPDRSCKHNLNYWQFGDYLGLGAGAHGKLTMSDGGVVREQRAAHPRDYLRLAQQGDAVSKRHTVTTDDLSFEFMLNNLRLSAGFNLAEFTRLTGLGGEVVLPSLMAAQKRGLLQDLGEGGWRPTPRGWQFLNDLQALFLP